MKLSVIIPCKNEEGNVLGLYQKIDNVLKGIKYEVIFVDDGSTDETIGKLREIYEKDMQHVKVISFSRNFKKEAAMYAGLKYASGEYTCIVDGDLQQNPKYFKDMMDFLDENKDYDEVAMVMKDRTVDSGFMKFCKKMFYGIIDKISEIHFENAASDFRMFRSNVRDAVVSLTERNRFSKGIFSWVGFKVKYLPYEVEPRTSGKSSFNFKVSLRYAIDGILAFSSMPLRIATRCGLLCILASIIYIIVLLILCLSGSAEWSIMHTILIVNIFLFGVLFILIGIVGEYLAKISNEVRNRPIYVIKETLGFNEKTIL